ncbi:MAG TPA: flagellar biosynthesis anti-sigma factor FlgM [Peptococcaceae bacterium]|nr:MAG: Anti-sigma-28 factor, FlgM family [Moorella sp. 60_41]HBT47574.1 flagellar biosynthesis anti-sigma factor FlgM [Peptococcaceae bacterium]
MKINGQSPINPPSLLEAYRRPARPEVKEPGGGCDRAEISARARQLQELVRLSSELPAVRADRVEELRAQVSSGNYRVSLEALADSLLRELKA